MADPELYPIRNVRFRGGRTEHRTKRPADWDDRLEAACGKTGYRATGFSAGGASQCPGCREAITGQ